jgi:hypothetical protein
MFKVAVAYSGHGVEPITVKMQGQDPIKGTGVKIVKVERFG